MLFCILPVCTPYDFGMKGYNFFLYLHARFKNQIAVSIVQGNTGVGRLFNYFEEQMIQKAFSPVDFRQLYHYTLLEL